MSTPALTLSHRQTWESIGIGKQKFYELKSTGLFDRLESPIPHRYSKEKVEAFLAGRSVHQRAWPVAS